MTSYRARRPPGKDNWGLSTRSPLSGQQRRQLHVVTIVSGIRLVGAPIFVLLFVSPVEQEFAASLPFLVLLFLTDVLDGYLARRWNVATNFGYILDGVADRSAHIAVIIALIAKNEIAPVLGFLLIFRDVVLYAARSLFESWWTANSEFRLRVKIAAVVFKLTIGGIAMLSYIITTQLVTMSGRFAVNCMISLHSATWAFAIWSYVLLAQQVHKYAAGLDVPASGN